MRILIPAVAAALGALAGCAGPEPDPVLSAPLAYVREHYSETQALVNFEGRLEVTVTPEGRVESTVRRSLFADVRRKGPLSPEQRDQLRALVAGWTAKGSELPPPKGKVAGSVSLGDRKVEWAADQKLPPELAALARFLESLVRDLPKDNFRTN